MILRLPYSLIQEFLQPCSGVVALSDNMTQIGHECAVVYPSPIDKNVVVGHVVTVKNHDNADKLKVCEVDVGLDDVLQIVCGCPSVRPGMIVPVAQVGVKLSNINIKRSKLRGVVSEGMLCSAKELGLEGHDAGLMSLPNSFYPGQIFANIDVFTSPVLEFDITPNRGDCLSVFGLLRDYVAKYGGQINHKIKRKDDFPHQMLARSETDKADSFCAAKLIISSGQLPIEKRHQLTQAGIKLISPVVDVLHYVMLLYGQPMHAYDADQLKGSLRALQGLKREVVLIDGQTIHTDSSDIVICDDESVVSLAGIMGSSETMVSPNSKNIFLEACYFDPSAITVTNRLQKIQSDAAMRYERGVDPSLAHEAIFVVLALMQSYDIASVVCVDVCEYKPNATTIKLRKDQISKKLGVDIPSETVVNILTKLHCLVDNDSTCWHVTVPQFRFDLKQEIDLIEEVVRLYGYDQISVEIESFKPSNLIRENKLFRLSQFLSASGLQEVVTYSLISQDEKKYFGLKKDTPEILNPINNQMTHLRESMLPGLYKVAKYNSARQKNSHRYFEFARVFDGFHEVEKFAILLSGLREPTAIGSQGLSFNYFDIQAHLLMILNTCGIYEVSFKQCPVPGYVSFVDVCVAGKQVGMIAQLHPKFDLSDQSVFYAELNYNEILKHTSAVLYKEVSSHPEIHRDITWISEGDLMSEKLLKEIINCGLKHLKDAYVFDIFHNKSVDTGACHISTRLVFQSIEKTLTDKEIDQSLKQAIDHVCKLNKVKVG